MDHSLAANRTGRVKGLTRNRTLLSLLIYFSSYPLLYLVNVLLSRELGANEYGDFAVTRSVASLAATVALLGMDHAALRYLPVYRTDDEHERAKGFVIVAFLTVLVVGVVVSLAGYLITDFLHSRYADDTHPVTIAMLWVVPLSLGIFFTRILAGHDRMILASFLDRIVLPLATLIFLGGVFVLRAGLTDFTAVLLLVGSRVLLLFVLLALLWGLWRRQYQDRSTSVQAQEWLVGALPFLLTALVLNAMGQSGTLVLEAHHPTEESVGLFAAVRQVAYFPLLALAAISVSAMPELSVLTKARHQSAQGAQGAAAGQEPDHESLEERLGFYLRILTAFGVGSLAVFLLWGEDLIRLFGHDFQGGRLPLSILGVGYLISLIGGLVTPLFQVLERRRVVLVSMTALLVLNIASTYLLAPTYGATGAALAYTISVAIVYSAQTFWLQRSTGIPYLRSILGLRTSAT